MVDNSKLSGLELRRHLRLNVIRERLRGSDLDVVADLDDLTLDKLRRLVRNMPDVLPDGTILDR